MTPETSAKPGGNGENEIIDFKHVWLGGDMSDMTMICWRVPKKCANPFVEKVIFFSGNFFPPHLPLGLMERPVFRGWQTTKIRSLFALHM